MGCAASHTKQFQKTSKQALQLNQTQQIKCEEQSKFQMTKSPLSSPLRAPSINNQIQDLKKQHLRIEKLLFSKRKSQNSNIFLCPEEEYEYQRTIIRLLANK